MTLRRDHHGIGGLHTGGFTSFLRSLLSGIPWSERADGEEELHLTAPPGATFRLHNANGRMSVHGEDRSDIEVQMSKTARAESKEAAAQLLDAIRLVSVENGDVLNLEVEIPAKWNRRGFAHLNVRLPREIPVALTAVNGRIEIEGLRSRVNARSSNGSACISDVVGNVEVFTSNAKVCCSSTCGKLVARSSNGKIEIDEHRGSIDASTSNGLIRATLEEVGKHGVQLATSNGRILLELPEEVDADVDIRVDNGFIRNDRTLCQYTRNTNGRISGRLGSGGALIKLRTSNGSISIR